MVRKYNLSKAEKYIDKQGVEKTFWANVGVMTEFEKQDGSVSRVVEIPAIGLKASVFLQEPRQSEPRLAQTRQVMEKEARIDTIEYPDDGINIDEIPF